MPETEEQRAARKKREAEERRAQMVEEASQGRRAKRKPAKRPSQTAGDSDEP